MFVHRLDLKISQVFSILINFVVLQHGPDSVTLDVGHKNDWWAGIISS